MSTGVIARRRTRLGVIVAVASALVAVGVTGVGLLVPAGEGTPAVRLAGAVVALAAGAAVVRLDGAARAASSLIAVGIVGCSVCLATLPVSPVSLDLRAEEQVVGDGPADPGAGTGPGTVLDPGTDDAPADGAGTVQLPAGGDVVLEGGRVVLTDPAGGRLVLGQATLDGARPDPAREGTSIVVVDGVVQRSDGGDVGGDVALGGTTFERDDGSQVTVGDGSLFEVPDPIEVEDDAQPERVDALIALLLGVFTVLAFAPPAIRFGERHPVPLLDEPEPEPAAAPARPAVTVEAGLADVLRSMLADPDPRTSVIGAYARLLTAMAEAGHPRRDEEGPHEHLWRTLAPLGVRRQPVHRLAELFVRARFTPRPVTEDDRQAAIAALADAVADLRLQAHDVQEAAARIGVAG